MPVLHDREVLVWTFACLLAGWIVGHLRDSDTERMLAEAEDVAISAHPAVMRAEDILRHTF